MQTAKAEYGITLLIGEKILESFNINLSILSIKSNQPGIHYNLNIN